MEVLTKTDIAKTYNDVVDEARARVLQQMPRARMKLARIYAEELDIAYRRLALGEITEAEVNSLAESIERALRRYMARSDAEVKRQVIRVLEEMRRAHSDAVQRVAPDINVSFEGLPERAFEEMFKRRALGTVETFKTLTRHSAATSAKAVGRTLQMATAQIGPEEAVRRIAAEMAGGDPFLEKALEKWGRSISKFMRGAKAIPEDAAYEAARRMGYDAWRIVRTELAAASLDGDRIGAIQSPFVMGLKWTLSYRHPKPDICDLYAKLDLHGMGPGVFPPELLPPLPHPHDLCTTMNVMRDPKDIGKPKDEPQGIRKVKRSEIEGILAGQTGGAVTRAARQLQRDTARAEGAWKAMKPLLG